MRKILLGTHGRMASGMKSSVDILLGNSDCITALDAYVDEASVSESIEKFFSQVTENDTVLLLSDLYGGSVNQEMFKYLHKPRTFLISGVNLGLLIELAVTPDSPITEEELSKLIQECTGSMRLVKNESAPDGKEDFF